MHQVAPSSAPPFMLRFELWFCMESAVPNAILGWQILLARAEKDYPRQIPPPLRFIRSCSSSLAAPTLHKLEATFHVPVLEVYPLLTP